MCLPIVSAWACTDRKAAPAREPDNSFELNETTVAELQSRMASGQITSKKICELYLGRIDRIDRQGIRLNSVIELNPDALAIASQLDDERKAGKVRGPMHGIPVLIKDNIDTGDRMMTTAGSLALEGNYASRDAFIASRLREAGAVILGKTNLSEWANFRAERSSSGWSSRGGQTKHPYVLDRNPCGSSSGTGAAVSANLCAVGIGTETNGSIACPSSINGIVGIKPTVGLWSRSGIIPISASQDTAGPMARTVADAASLLACCIGVDPNDPATASSTGKAAADYTSFLSLEGLKGKRIGVEKKFLKVHESIDTLLRKALEQMRGQGAEIVEVELVNNARSSKAYDLLKYEFKDGVNRYLAGAHAKVKSLREVIEFNTQNEAKAMPYFKQDILEASEAMAGLDSQEYMEVKSEVQSKARQAIDSVLSESRLDAVCGPANGPSWCTDLINGDMFTGYGFYSPAAVAGYPSIVVPMGFVEELPVGLAFIGPAYGEGPLISIAYAYEQASRNRRPPRFLATLDPA
jgi:amidase